MCKIKKREKVHGGIEGKKINLIIFVVICIIKMQQNESISEKVLKVLGGSTMFLRFDSIRVVCLIRSPKKQKHVPLHCEQVLRL